MNMCVKSALIASGAILVSFGAFAADPKPEGGPYKETVEGVEWTFRVVNGEASVGGGSSSSTAVPTSTTGDIAIPSLLGGRPVTCIGGSAFCDCTGLASLTIHQDVTNVGYRAFEYWGKSNSLFFEGRPLQGIDMAHISSGVKLWYNGQYYTEWNPHIKTCVWTNAKAYIPFPPVPDGGPYKESVNGIEWMFFVTNGEACVGTGKAAAAIPTTTKGAIRVPSELGGRAVTGIGNSAFSMCSDLTGVTIPEGVTSLGTSLFYCDFKITELTVPASVTNITVGAFYACFALKDIRVDEGNQHYVSIDGVVYTKDGTSLLCCVPAKKSVSILTSVTNICSLAFGECRELESITLPPNLTTLGYNVFYSCKITELTFPSSLVRIGGNLFPGCSLLTTFYFKGAPPERIEYGGFKTNATIWYNVKYFDEWQPVIKQCGWTNARPYNPVPGFMLFLR